LGLPRFGVHRFGATPGLWAEAIRKPALFARLRSTLRWLHNKFVTAGASQDLALAMLALAIGFMVMGAIDPELTRGRAANACRKLLENTAIKSSHTQKQPRHP